MVDLRKSSVVLESEIDFMLSLSDQPWHGLSAPVPFGDELYPHRTLYIKTSTDQVCDIFHNKPTASHPRDTIIQITSHKKNLQKSIGHYDASNRSHFRCFVGFISMLLEF